MANSGTIDAHFTTVKGQNDLFSPFQEFFVSSNINRSANSLDKLCKSPVKQQANIQLNNKSNTLSSVYVTGNRQLKNMTRFFKYGSAVEEFLRFKQNFDRYLKPVIRINKTHLGYSKNVIFQNYNPYSRLSTLHINTSYIYSPNGISVINNDCFFGNSLSDYFLDMGGQQIEIVSVEPATRASNDVLKITVAGELETMESMGGWIIPKVRVANIGENYFIGFLEESSFTIGIESEIRKDGFPVIATTVFRMPKTDTYNIDTASAEWDFFEADIIQFLSGIDEIETDILHRRYLAGFLLDGEIELGNEPSDVARFRTVTTAYAHEFDYEYNRINALFSNVHSFNVGQSIFSHKSKGTRSHVIDLMTEQGIPECLYYIRKDKEEKTNIFLNQKITYDTSQQAANSFEEIVSKNSIVEYSSSTICYFESQSGYTEESQFLNDCDCLETLDEQITSLEFIPPDLTLCSVLIDVIPICLSSGITLQTNIYGGTPPFTLSGYTEGTILSSNEPYEITVTDAAGCVSNTVSGITICLSDFCLDNPPILSWEAICNEENTGANVVITITGGTAPYTLYNIVNNQFLLNGESIIVYATDANGCETPLVNIEVNCIANLCPILDLESSAELISKTVTVDYIRGIINYNFNINGLPPNEIIENIIVTITGVNGPPITGSPLTEYFGLSYGSMDFAIEIDRYEDCTFQVDFTILLESGCTETVTYLMTVSSEFLNIPVYHNETLNLH